jgi:hypothetical protein
MGLRVDFPFRGCAEAASAPLSFPKGTTRTNCERKLNPSLKKKTIHGTARGFPLQGLGGCAASRFAFRAHGVRRPFDSLRGVPPYDVFKTFALKCIGIPALFLAEFNQHSLSGFGMQEGNSLVVGTLFRGCID